MKKSLVTPLVVTAAAVRHAGSGSTATVKVGDDYCQERQDSTVTVKAGTTGPKWAAAPARRTVTSGP